MEKRQPRNAITSQRRIAKSPFNPKYNPDLQRSLPTNPGFPPDTDGFIVSTFTGRFPLQEDFFYRVNAGEVINGQFEDIDIFPAPGQNVHAIKAPPGYRLIIQSLYIPALCTLSTSPVDFNNDAPFTPAGGITQIGVWGVFGNLLGVYLDGEPVQSLVNSEFGLTNGYTFDPSEALIYGPMSIDCFIRVETGSVCGIGQFTNPAAGGGSVNMSYLLPFVEFRGQIEAVDNYELQTLGLTKKPVPTSEAEGLRLLRKRSEGRNT